ncbi:MAG: hypothetical protein WD751_09360 [Anaerolineales bacterium]
MSNYRTDKLIRALFWLLATIGFSLTAFSPVTTIKQDETLTASFTDTASETQTQTPTSIQSPTITETSTVFPTVTPTQSSSPTESISPTASASATPSSTPNTSTATSTSTETLSLLSDVDSGRDLYTFSRKIYEVQGLPWLPGQTWLYNQGPHGGQLALDFGTPTGRSEIVYAAFTGIAVDPHETCVGIRRESDSLIMWYQHIDNRDIKKITPGQTIKQGKKIGATTLSFGCGGQAGGQHVHIYFMIGTQYVRTTMNGWGLVGLLAELTKFSPLHRDFGNETAIPKGENQERRVMYCAKPLAPELKAPGAKAALGDTTPTLSWKKVACAGQYEVRIATSSNFEQNKIVQNPFVTDLSYTATTLGDGRYYWQVRADGIYENGPWSTPQYFEIDTVAPNAPILSSPVDLYFSVGTPLHSWKKVSTAVSYELQYLTIPALNSLPLLDEAVFTQKDIKNNSAIPAFNGYGKFLWRVRAVDAAGNPSNWSSSRIVIIAAPKPGQPVLTSPANKKVITDTTPAFYWKSVAYGNYYQIQISTSSSFSSSRIVREKTLLPGDLNYGASTLPKGTYYWRVRAFNVDGTAGSWSAVFSLTIR